MLASIIIPIYNRKNELRECLHAIPETLLDALQSEIIVVDDESTDGVAAMLQDEFPHVRLLENTSKTGPGVARNLGARASQGDLLLFLDSDAVPEPGWLQEMLQNNDGHTILIGRILDYNTHKIQYGPRRSTFIGKSLPSSPKRANMGPSGNLGVPRACFDAVGGFWEEISYAFEDSYFSLNAKAKGYSFRYLMNATILHKGSVKRSGEGIRLTEHNGVYAMLIWYRHSTWRRVVFTIINGTWLAVRMICWTLKGRGTDARLLAAGWISAYKRFWAKERGDMRS